MNGHVLVIDGDPEMQNLFTRILELDNHYVQTAADIDAFVSENTESPDICLVAASLRPEDPAALADEVGRRWNGCDVIYLVDESTPDLRKAIDRRRLRRLVRPFQIEDLRDLVNRTLRRRKRQMRPRRS